MNIGTQKSSSTPRYAYTTFTPGDDAVTMARLGVHTGVLFCVDQSRRRLENMASLFGK